MIDKKEFCALLREFKSIVDDTQEAHEALRKLDPDFGGLHLSRHEDFALSLIERLVEDDAYDSMTSYFIYERDWGRRDSEDELGPVTIGGKNYKMKTPEQLYDVILAVQENNKKENADT